MRLARYPFVLLSMLVIPRMMNPAVYGQYALFLSVFLILDILTDVGITQIFGRFVPEHTASGNKAAAAGLLQAVLAYGLALALLAIALLWGLTLSGLPALSVARSHLTVISLLLLFTKIEGVLFAFLYGLNHIARFSTKEVLRSAFTFVLVFAFFKWMGLKGALWALVVNEILLSTLGLWWTRDYLFGTVERPAWSRLRYLLIFGVQFYIPAFLFGLMQRSGNLFVKHFTDSPEAVSAYDIANQFLLLAGTFLGLIFATLLPALTELQVRGHSEKADRWQRLILTYSGICIALSALALAWLGKPVIKLCLGTEFEPVFPNALITIFAMAPMMISYAGTNITLLRKEPHIYAVSVGAGFGGLAIGCWVLVPHYGALGASIATVVAYTLMALVFLLRYPKRLFPLMGGLAISLLLGLVPAPLLWKAHASLPVSILLLGGTVLFYIGLLLLTRILKLDDARRLAEAFKK